MTLNISSLRSYAVNHAPLLLIALQLSLRPLEVADGATYDTDAIITLFRIDDVVSDAAANHANDDSFNPHSVFNQTIYHDGRPASGLTGFGVSLASLSILLNLISFLIKIMQTYYVIEKQSYIYLHDHIAAIDPEFDLSFAEMAAELNQFLLREKISGRGADQGYRIDKQDDVLIQLVRDSNDLHYQQSLFAERHHASHVEDELDPQISESFKPNLLVRISNKIRHSFLSNMLKKIWDYSFFSSMIYWVACYALMVIGGGAVAVGLTATGVLPILGAIALIPVAVFALYTLGWNIGKYLYGFINTKKHRLQQVKKIDAINDATEQYKIRELTQRYFVKKQHAYYRDGLFAKAAGFKFSRRKINVDEAYDEDEEQQKLRWQEKWLKIKLRLKQEEQALARVNEKERIMQQAFELDADAEKYQRDTVENVLNSDLAKHLLGRKAEIRSRLALIFTQDVINGFLMVSFILALAAAVIAVPTVFLPVAAVPVLSSVAIFLTGGTMTANIVITSLCATVGLLFGINSLIKTHTADREREKKVYEVLSAQYKKEGISKLEKFECNQALIENKINHINKLRNNELNLDEDEKILQDYKLEDVNVYNNYYFEKQKQAPSRCTRTKQVAKATTEIVVLGPQAMIYVARALFLLGGVGAFTLAFSGIGTLPAFLLLAFSFGLAGLLMKAASYQMQRQQRHRDFFIHTIDARLSYQHKKLKELTFIEESLLAKQQATVLKQQSVSHQVFEKKKEVSTGVSNDSAPQLVEQLSAARQRTAEDKKKLIDGLIGESPSRQVPNACLFFSNPNQTVESACKHRSGLSAIGCSS